MPRRRTRRLHQIARTLPVLGLLTGVLGAASPCPAADSDGSLGELHSRIVNGSVTSAYPTVGALLVYEDAEATSLYGLCSGTLIGCRTFLTAAHCVCPDEAMDGASCRRQGLTDSDTMRVFLQHGGVFAVDSAIIYPDYSFAERGDLAVITLAEPVTGIAPSPINSTSRAAAGTAGAIVGFGTTGDGFMSSNDAGVKREGAITTAACGEDIDSDVHLCWDFSGAQSNVCSGDSGGPLFIDHGLSATVAAVTSGSFSFDCQPPDMSFDTDVFVFRSWVEDAAGAMLESTSCDLPAVRSDSTRALTTSGRLSTSSQQARVQFEVAAGTSLLRVALNGQLGSSSGFFGQSNDFDLYLRAGNAPSTGAYDCADTNPTTFGYCEIAAPEPGTWHALVQRTQGDGVYQITATTFAAASAGACVCDCNGDVEVSGDEIGAAVALALSGAAAADCTSADASGDGEVTIDELVLGVRSRLETCEAQ